MIRIKIIKRLRSFREHLIHAGNKSIHKRYQLNIRWSGINVRRTSKVRRTFVLLFWFCRFLIWITEAPSAG